MKKGLLIGGAVVAMMLSGKPAEAQYAPPYETPHQQTYVRPDPRAQSQMGPNGRVMRQPPSRWTVGYPGPPGRQLDFPQYPFPSGPACGPQPWWVEQSPWIPYCGRPRGGGAGGTVEVRTKIGSPPAGYIDEAAGFFRDRGFEVLEGYDITVGNIGGNPGRKITVSAPVVVDPHGHKLEIPVLVYPGTSAPENAWELDRIGAVEVEQVAVDGTVESLYRALGAAMPAIDAIRR